MNYERRAHYFINCIEHCKIIRNQGENCKTCFLLIFAFYFSCIFFYTYFPIRWILQLSRWIGHSTRSDRWFGGVRGVPGPGGVVPRGFVAAVQPGWFATTAAQTAHWQWHHCHHISGGTDALQPGHDCQPLLACLHRRASHWPLHS